MKLVYAAALLLTVLLCQVPAEARTFTDVQGRKIEAQVIEISDGSVTLQISGRSGTHAVPLSNLSEGDRLYLKSLRESTAAVTDQKALAVTNKGNLPSQLLMQRYRLKENFTADWPRLISTDISPEISTVEENEEEQRFIYHSPNYEFICDVRLSNNVVKKFAVMFEATREYCRQLPISTMKAHIPGEMFRNKILLFESEHDYIKNGGIVDSAGCFIFGNDVGTVLVPLTSLGVKKVGSGYMYDHDKSSKTLAHEIVHQLTDYEYFSDNLLGWFSEGLAEYCAITPYRSGKYMVKTNLSAIEEYVTAFGKDNSGGRNLGDEFSAPDLEKFMLMPYDDFRADGNLHYGLGLLITTYFFHMEEDRRSITRFLKALKQGLSGEEALKALLQDRSFEELEDQIYKAWKSKGIKIQFQ
ncbi:MAG: hypothetical protein ACSHX0_11860 [Akkermansiaceae bacterium]